MLIAMGRIAGCAMVLAVVVVIGLFVIVGGLGVVFGGNHVLKADSVHNFLYALQQGYIHTCGNPTVNPPHVVIDEKASTQFAAKLDTQDCEQALQLAKQKLQGVNIEEISLDLVDDRGEDYMRETRFDLGPNPLGIKYVYGRDDSFELKPYITEIG
ncbi:hypothetical protein [Streptosporangium sp. NPDC000396]|uniref:hypothetical protein n=1 Tax=Streptosporangium sp. NPDC000396 TaxID=3366185 RepID=UPI00368E9B2C